MYSRTHFPNQKPDEKVLLFLRRHWVEVLRIILLAVFLLVVPMAIYLALSSTRYLDNQGFYAVYVLLNSAYFLFVILFTFSNFIDYYLDVWIVTDQRVVNIEQKGLFAREVSEKDLGRMQDITSDVKGFWATVFHYGDIHIQTAGEEQRFIFKQVPDAEEVSRKISNLVAEYHEKNPQISEQEDKL